MAKKINTGASAPPAPKTSGPLKKGMRCYESVQKCDVEADVFRQIRFYSTPFANVPYKQNDGLDSQEDVSTPEMQVEKEVHEKFYKGQYKFFSEEYSFFAWIAKRIFLMLAVPLYVIFYKIPKWLFGLISIIFSSISTVLFACSQKISKMKASLQSIRDSLKGFQKSKNEKSKKQSLYTIFMHSYVRWEDWFKQRKIDIKRSILFYKRFILQKFLAIENILRSFFTPLEQRINNALKKVLIAFLAPIRSFITQVKHNLIKQPIQKLYKIRKFFAVRVQSKLHAAKEYKRWLFARARDEIKNFPKRCYRFLYWAIDEKFIPFVKAKIKQVQQFRKTVSRKYELFKSQVRGALGLPGKALKVINQAIKLKYTECKDSICGYYNFIKLALAKRKVLIVQGYNSNIERMKAKFGNLITSLKETPELLKEQFRLLNEEVSKRYSNAKNIYKKATFKFINSFKPIFAKISDSISEGKDAFIAFGKGILTFCILARVWAKVLFKYGMEQVREFTEKRFSK